LLATGRYRDYRSGLAGTPRITGAASRLAGPETAGRGLGRGCKRIGRYSRQRHAARPTEP